MEIYHLNCVEIVSPFGARGGGHCLLLKLDQRLILIDAGIGLLDVKNPQQRIGQELIGAVGYQFNEVMTAYKQIEALGLNPENVTDCIISHLDNDHIGGLADFPNATVHISLEEYENYLNGNPRYLKTPLAHEPEVITYASVQTNWLGFEARKIKLQEQIDIFLVPLFGHTLGHCGVAIKQKDTCIFYVGDAYYLRAEISDPNHPVSELAKLRADNDALRVATLDKIRKLMNEHLEIEVFGYHDIEEYNRYQL